MRRQLALVAVALIALGVAAFPRRDGLSQAVDDLPAGVTRLAADLTVLGDPVVVIATGAAVYALGRWTSVLSEQTATYILAGILLAVGAAAVLKPLFDLARPALGQAIAGSGFPSGHAMGAAALAAAGVLYGRQAGAIDMRLLLGGGVVLVGVVAVSRVFIGAHYVEDVAVGAGIGVVLAVAAQPLVTRAVEVVP